ncbi:MAG: dipicolinate synthase subunit DpsA [Halanaerobiales bacterium]|nr:dipicolinate synthase subunit DpsA [Halanaerobiales bacterium]
MVLIKKLASLGYSLRVLGSINELADRGIYFSNQLSQVVADAEVVIAPMSSTNEQGFLKATYTTERVKLDEDFFALLKPGTLFLIGIARPTVQKALTKYNIKYVQLALLDDLAILNAIPTAEGAIKIAIEETDYTIFGSKTLVLGLGKVGLTLAWRLKMLGADSYAVTRERASIARGIDLGIKMLTYQELTACLPEMNILYNTVPAMMIKRKELELLAKDSLIIDLASAPGGTDFAAAEQLGIKAILALGLPGKVAPQTAGKILADLIPDLIKEKLAMD